MSNFRASELPAQLKPKPNEFGTARAASPAPVIKRVFTMQQTCLFAVVALACGLYIGTAINKPVLEKQQQPKAITAGIFVSPEDDTQRKLEELDRKIKDNDEKVQRELRDLDSRLDRLSSAQSTSRSTGSNPVTDPKVTTQLASQQKWIDYLTKSSDKVEEFIYRQDNHMSQSKFQKTAFRPY
ncbi:MAG: hypothetical protein V4543_00210 [Bacteroidota bacterium]